MLPARLVPQGPNAEIGVNQQKGLHGQILKFQVPGGVIGRHVGNVGKPPVRQVLPGEVVM